MSPPQPLRRARPPSAQRPKRATVVLVAILALLGAAATVVTIRARKHDPTTRNARAATQLRGALSDRRLSDEELSAIDATDLWYAEFRTMLQQPVLHTVHEYTVQGEEQTVRQQLTVDLRNHQFNYESGTYGGLLDGAPNDISAERCVGGHTYTRSKRPGKPTTSWVRGSLDRCDFKLLDASLFADGLGTGALTPEEADAMIGYLRKKDDFLRARQAKVVTRNNKQYIRFAVEITPVRDRQRLYAGLGRFLTAFAETALDPGSYPYLTRSAGAERFIMYVDPTTLLPAYAQFADTAPADAETGVRDEQGFAEKLTDTSVDRVEFDFTQQKVVPQTLKDFKDISLHWPEEKYPPHIGGWQP